MAVGAALILSALALLLHNRYADARAGREAETLLASVEAAISSQVAAEPEKTRRQETRPTGQITPTEPTAPEALDPEMPVAMLEGYGYVGYVEIPALGLKLPVMSDWDYTRLEIAPCRQFGSSRTDDLVIAAHNFESHFGRLKEMSLGNTVTFTDMAGIVNTYRAEMIELLSPKDVEAVQNSGYDLVLYTCTKGGQTRIVLFCNRMDKTADKNEQPKSK